MKLLLVLLLIWLVYVITDKAPASPTYAALLDLRTRLLDGKSISSKAAKHILLDEVLVFKQHPELFSIGEPYPLDVVETGERVWAVDMTRYDRARDKSDPHAGHVEVALFHDTNTKTLKPYIW